MNIQSVATWIAGLVIAAAAAGHLAGVQSWIWRSEAKVISESRTSTWGSPRFFPQRENK